MKGVRRRGPEEGRGRGTHQKAAERDIMRQPNKEATGQGASAGGVASHVPVGMEGPLSPMRDLSPMPTSTWACHPGTGFGGCYMRKIGETNPMLIWIRFAVVIVSGPASSFGKTRRTNPILSEWQSARLSTSCRTRANEPTAARMASGRIGGRRKSGERSQSSGRRACGPHTRAPRTPGAAQGGDATACQRSGRSIAWIPAVAAPVPPWPHDDRFRGWSPPRKTIEPSAGLDRSSAGSRLA